MSEIDELYERIKDLSSELLEEEKIRDKAEADLASALAENAEARKFIELVAEEMPPTGRYWIVFARAWLASHPQEIPPAV